MMKKIIMIFILLVSLTSFAFAKSTFIESYNEVPIELQGVWYTIVFSEDCGTTLDSTERPFLNVTRRYISTARSALTITKIDKYFEDKDIKFEIFTEDPATMFILVYVKGKQHGSIVYGLRNGSEVFRSLIDIRK